MISNYYLRSIRFMLDINDAKLAEIFNIGGEKVDSELMKAYLRIEEDEGFIRCPDETMAHFLDGLVILKRGKDETRAPLPIEVPVTNNVVLKKLKVAFSLKEEDIHEVLDLSGFKIGRSEVSAFLRKKGHINYRECGDQFLRNFLKGLSIKLRG